MFFSQQLAGTPQAGLDLIQNHDDIVLGAYGSGLAQVAVRRDDHPGFTLNRLSQKSNGVRCDGCFEGITIAVWNNLKSGGKGTKIFASCFVRAETNDADGATMKIIFTHDDFSLIFSNPFDLIAPLANSFDDGFNRLSATVHRQYFMRIGQITEFFIEQTQLIVPKRSGRQS